MSLSFQNIYHLRRVADTAAKSCYVCHKPSSSVLITPDTKDFFYVCPVHLKDRHFCTPVVDTEEQEKNKKEALAQEIEKVKKEYEEKQKRKKEKAKENNSDEESKKQEGSSNTDKKEGPSDEKERDDKIESLKKSAPSASTSDDGPRIFALHNSAWTDRIGRRNFYQMRIDRLRNLEAAKRNRQRLQDPSFFPSVPSGGV